MPHSVENGFQNGETSVEEEFFEQISEQASDVQSVSRFTAAQDLLPTIQMEEFSIDERLHLEEVLKRTAVINEAEIIRQQELKNELDSMVVNKEGQEDNEKACHCCGETFSFFFNPKKQCGQCSLLVCEKCINVFRKGVTQICRLCYIEDIHEGQTGKWFMITLQKHGRNACFGCDILRASLRRQKEQDDAAVRRREEELERERIAAANAEAAAEAAAAAAATAPALETGSKGSQKSKRGDRLSLASAASVTASQKKWRFGKKSKKDSPDAASDSVSLSLGAVPSAPESVISAPASEISAPSAPESVISATASEISAPSAPESVISAPGSDVSETSMVSRHSVVTVSIADSQAASVTGAEESIKEVSPDDDESAQSLHEERAVDVVEQEDSISASIAQASASEIPTINIEANTDDQKWTDQPFSDDESHIFPHFEGDEEVELGALKTPRSAVSHESLTSIYSDTSASYKLAVDVTGEVQVTLQFDFKHNIFLVKVKQCKDIAAVDSKRNKSDPYVKTYLLPDKTKVSKRKTSYRKATLNPVFDEQVKYVISKSELDTRILSVAVWHRVALGHNIFLGEVHIHLEDHDFEDVTPKWYPLHEKKDIAIPMPLMMYKGDLIFAVKFMPAEVGENDALGEVQVWVKQARNLIAATSNGYSDAFCKGYLLPDRAPSGKKKTRVIRRNLNPAWNTVLRFTGVKETTLADRALELSVWDYGRFRPNEFLGGLRLNLGLGVHAGKHVRWMDARGHEMTMWQAMMSRPRAWIEGTLMLRPNMD